MRTFPVFVIGMHRSGTTLLTRILSELGLFMGRHRDSNEETHLLINVNEQMLHRAGATWDNPGNFLKSLEASHFEATYQYFLRCLSIPEKAFFLGEKRYAECGGNLAALAEPWGAKDPRLTYTLPLWHRLLPNLKIIHIMRHGVDVAASLRHRHCQLVDTLFKQTGMPVPPPDKAFWTGIVKHTTACLELKHSLQLWADYMGMAERHVASFKENALEIRYEDLLAQPTETLKLITNFLEIETSSAPATLQSLKADRLYGYRQQEELSRFAEEQASMLSRFGYKP